MLLVALTTEKKRHGRNQDESANARANINVHHVDFTRAISRSQCAQILSKTHKTAALF
jgi:hypothetical protein